MSAGRKGLLLLSLVAIMTLAGALAATPVFGEGGQDKGPATHIIVFNDGVDPHGAARDLGNVHGVKPEFVYKNAFRGMSGIVPPGKEADVLGHPDVAYIERNQVVRISQQTMPTGIQRIFADDNPNITIDGNDDFRIDVDVAVIDTGIDFDHPDLNVVARTNCAKGGPLQTEM